MMTVELTYAYSKLAKQPSFGIVFTGYEQWEAYPRWVYFYLGAMLEKRLGKRRIGLHPYSIINVIKGSKILKTYKHCNDAKRQALLIALKIIKYSK